METVETLADEGKSEENETVDDSNVERDLKSSSKYIKEHTFYTQTEALLSTNSKNDLQDLFKK